MNYLEIIGTVVGLVYLYLEYRASVWLWVASIAMPVIYLFVYYEAGLYADFGISIYYILASVYGLVCWLKSPSKDNDEALKIKRTPRFAWLPLAIAFAVTFAIISFILTRFTDSVVPVADAFTTALSIIAMWMLARKYIEQWIVWILADAGCAALYLYKGLWFTAGLYLLYAIIAVFGYINWKRKL